MVRKRNCQKRRDEASTIFAELLLEHVLGVHFRLHRSVGVVEVGLVAGGDASAVSHGDNCWWDVDSGLECGPGDWSGCTVLQLMVVRR